ncbi:MAG: ABC transporter ATP-binding protein [Christensenellales bacterium]
MALIEIKGLTFTYPEREAPALKNINLDINEGDFIVLCGKSGCGKSTLLRHLKAVLVPHGQREGGVYYRGKPLEEMDERAQTSKIGFVLQDPDHQIVTDKVWHELAYGLESLGYDTKTIRLRVAEMASFFGIQGWYHKTVFELSGGQKQLLNLASIMAMQPEVLMLDEPTSQLDPIAAADFLATIKKINTEIGTTIILTEHRLEDALPLADKVVVMGKGEIIAQEEPKKVGAVLKQKNDPMLYAMPAPTRLYLALENGGAECPVTVREGKEYLRKYAAAKDSTLRRAQQAAAAERQKVVTLKDVWFRYEKQGEDILRDLSVEIRQGETYCIVGGNGTGKTTALNVIAGINRPYRGSVRINGLDAVKAKHNLIFENGLSVLPQDPQSLFLKKTVEEDLFEMLSTEISTEQEKQHRVQTIAEVAEIEDLMRMHPYDISGGEQQRVALAKVLLTNPKILLMDEPTKGMDSFFKLKFAGILKKLKERGVTVVIVSHDIEFCAVHADRCALFFDGGIVTENDPHTFFSGNSFYTTSTNRMCRHLFMDAITVEDAVERCRIKSI